MRQAFPHRSQIRLKTRSILACVCVVLSSVFSGVPTLQPVQAAQHQQATVVAGQDTLATPTVARIAPHALVYLPLVTNYVASTPTVTPEPVVSLEQGCQTPGITRGTALAQVDSTLATLYCQREVSSTTTAPVDPVIKPNLTTDGSRVRVEIVAIDRATVAQTVADIEVLGADHIVLYQNLIAANVPLPQLPQLAQLATVQSVRLANATNHLNPVNLPEARAQLRQAIPQAALSGSVIGQQVAQLQADQLQAAPDNLTGAGVKIGLISDSYNCYAASGRTPTAATGLANGELPANLTVLNDATTFGLNCANQSDETRALVEATYDVAPGATYAVAAMGASKADFATSIQALINWGAQVIATDVVYINEAMFQDDIIAQLFDQAKAQGVTVFTLSHNNRDYSWQGPGLDSNQNNWLEFDKAGTEKLTFTPASSGYYRTILTWDQPFKSISGQMGNVDLALLIYRSADNTLIASSDWNNYTNDPYEWTVPNLVGGTSYYIAVKKNSGTTPGLVKLLFQNSAGVTFSPATSAPTIYGNANSLGAITVAGYAYNALPYYFNSRGAVPILFDKAGNRLTTAVTRPKPAAAATTGFNTSFFGVDDPADADSYPNFWGTSAAVPAAAGVGLLLLQAKPYLSPAQLAFCLTSTARDLIQTGTGFDPITGAGLIQAVPAFQCALTLPVLPTPTPSATSGTPTPIVTDDGQGDGNPGAGSTTMPTSTPNPAYQCLTDSAGIDDQPGQKDITKFCVSYANVPTNIPLTWDWDEISVSGSNTLDACSLFDTDGDGKINYAVCATTTDGRTASTTMYSCGDDKVDRCTSPTTPLTSFQSSCSVAVQNTDPFPASATFPQDMVASCTLQLSDINMPSATLVDVCSYPSQQPNSDPSDCVMLRTQAGKLTIQKVLSPATDSGAFNLQLDGSTLATGGNGTTTGKVMVTTGNHTVGETASAGVNLGVYQASIQCRDLGGSGSVVATASSSGPLTVKVSGGDDIVCTITNIAPTPTNTPTNTPTATSTVAPATATPTKTLVPPTNTPVPPTATNTPTRTSTPTNTPTNTSTMTPTNTPVPPTATNTPVPPTDTPPNTATNTAVPATATPTKTPVPPTNTPTPTNTPSPTATLTPTPLPTGSIGNRFWEDTNANGMQESGEPSVVGATVKLWVDSNNDNTPDTLLASTTTDSSGKYQFAGLNTNLVYIVQFVPPSGRVFTLKDAAGSTESTDSDANASGYTDAFTVAPGANGEIGAGLQPLASIGNRVWEDVNADGIQDVTEVGISGVEVRLWVDNNNDGTPDTQLLTTTTTTNGAYQFTGLNADWHYIVQFVPPSGRSFTLKDAAGSTESTDSDANPDGYTDVVTVAPGQKGDVGAGLLPLPFDLALSKTLATGQSPFVEVGDNVTFTLQVTNRSAITAANIELVDYVPSGLVLNDSRWSTMGSGKADYVIAGPVAPGAAASIDIIMTVGTVNNLRSANSSCAQCGTVVNTAEIVSAEDVYGNIREDLDLTNDQSQVAIQVGVPALTLKLTTTTATAQPGVLLTYQLVYSNTNNYGAQNVVLKTTVPQYTTFVAASSAPGWRCAAVTAGSACTYPVGAVAPNTPASTPLAFTVLVDNPLDASALLLYNQSLLTYGTPPLTAWTTTVTTPVQRTRSAGSNDAPAALPHQFYLPLIQQGMMPPQVRALFQKPALATPKPPLLTFIQVVQILAGMMDANQAK